MRTHEQLIEEIAIRKALDLPRIELTPEEKRRAFGDRGLVERRISGVEKAQEDLAALHDRLIANGLKPPADMRRKVREFRKGKVNG